jgi:hypothetical protein
MNWIYQGSQCTTEIELIWHIPETLPVFWDVHKVTTSLLAWLHPIAICIDISKLFLFYSETTRDLLWT